MILVDAQAHIWGRDTLRRPWLPGAAAAAHRRDPVGAAETLRLMDAAGVRCAVLVPPSWEGDRNDLVWAAARRRPDRFAVMARFAAVGRSGPPPRGAADRLARWREQPGTLGVRLTLHRDPWRAAFLSGAMEWFWDAAEAAGVPVMVYPPGLCAEIGRTARRHPGLRLVVDHLAIPATLKGPNAFAHLPDLLALARLGNVAVKASALPCHSLERFPFTDVHEPLRRAYDSFGPHRMFWGSDWTRLPCSYQENIALFTEAAPLPSGPDLELIMGRALLAWLRWRPAAFPAAGSRAVSRGSRRSAVSAM